MDNGTAFSEGPGNSAVREGAERETARVLGCVALPSPRRGRHSGSHGRQPVGKGVKEFELSPRGAATHHAAGALLAETDRRLSLQANSSRNT
jgi:hypothetical protein